MLGRTDTQLGRGETIADTARVLSRYVDIIMMRTTVEEKLLEMAKYATVPVINGLTDKTHPCQLMADVMTYEEHRGPIQGKAIAWSGDGNNMATSWIHAAVQFDFELRIACPTELKPPQDVVQWAEKSKGRITIGHDPETIVRGADCVVTDTWVSMGDEDPQSPSAARRHNLLRGYQVDQRLMNLAKSLNARVLTNDFNLNKVAGYASPKLDSLFSQGKSTSNLKQRKAIYTQISKTLESQGVWVWMFTANDYYAVNSKVRNFIPMANESLQYLRQTSLG